MQLIIFYKIKLLSYAKEQLIDKDISILIL